MERNLSVKIQNEMKLFSTLPGVVGGWVTSGVVVGVTLGVDDSAPAKQTNR